jgi:signal transduction histidine kinase
MEALARGLCEHRDHLPSGQIDEHLKGLVAEIRRVRALVAGRVGRPRTFDLAAAIGPVISCARASGLDVRCSVPPGVEVMGRRNCTAQVVLALLDNARKHAPGSPVELRVVDVDGSLALCVEDRGPGIPRPLRERLFERGVRGDDSTGSGLGLCVAKRLMAEQGGTIEVRSRRGGGASFVLCFQGPSPA